MCNPPFRVPAHAALLAAALLAGCGAAPPPDPPAPTPAAPTARAAVHRTLDNGLRLHAEQLADAPTLAVQLWMPAGAMHAEAPGVPALAAVTAAERLRAALAPLGGVAEGWVRADAAVLSVTVAPAHLDAALDALAMAVSTPADAAAQARAADRVRGMIAAAGRRADRAALRRLLGLTWGAHPAARPLLGAEPASGEAAEAFRAARFRPEGAALVAVGPLTAPALEAAARRALGGWSGAAAAVASPAPPKVGGPTVQVDEVPGAKARLRLAWPVPVATPTEAATADALALWLAGSADAPIPAALARAGVPAEARALVYAPGPHGLLVLEVDGPGGAVDAMWRAVAEAVAHAGRHGPSAGQWARALDAVDQAAAQAGADPAALARALGQRMLRWPGRHDAWRAALGRLDGAALAAAAARLTPAALSAVVLAPVPDGLDAGLWGERLAEAARADAPPPAGGWPGVEVQVVPRPGSGVVALHLRTEAGAATVPPDLLGAARVAARALAAPIPGVGRPVVELGPETLEVALTVPAERFPDAAGALLDRLMRPSWRADTVERARVAARAQRRQADPARAARRLLVADLARATGAPTAEPEAIDAGLESVPPARVAAWFDGFVTHGPLRVTVVGDVSEAAVRRALAAGLPADRRPVAMRPNRPPPPAPSGPVHRTARRVDGDRAAWAVGWPLGALTDDGLAATELALALVARAAEVDGVEVRLLVESRRASGRAGLVFSGPAPAVRAATARAIAAIDQRGQVPPTSPELIAAARWRIGRQTVALGDAAAFAAWVAGQADAGRAFVGPAALAQWRAALERTAGPAVRAAARANLPLDRRFEVWVGPGDPPETPDPPPAPAPPADPDPPVAPGV